MEIRDSVRPPRKAWLKAADYLAPDEEPNDAYPFWLITGRVVYQFHTRTSLFSRSRHRDFGLLRDLHGLYVLACDTSVTIDILLDGAMELRDHELVDFCKWAHEQVERQKGWCMTQAQDHAGEALVVRH